MLVLDDSNFDEAVKANDALLVEFYAPWCGHCKRLAPEYAAAAQKLKGEPVRLAKVDATEARDLATRFGIQGFPTLKFFRGDAENAVEYNGGREADGIVSWLRKKVGPVTRPLASVEEASTFADAADVVVIGFFAAGSEGEKAYSRVAANYEDITFGLTSSDEVRAAYGVAAGTSAIVAVNKFPGQENKVSFTGNVEDERSIATFVDGNSLPLVIPFSQENAPKIFRGPIKTHFLLFVDPASADYEQTVTALRGVATGYTGRLLFVTVDPSQDRVVSFFGVSAADMPTAVIVHMPEGESMKKFKMTAGTAITEQNMKAFVQDYQAGSLKPHLKSDPAPDAAAEAAAPVKTVVGTTFANIVLDTNKDVLLEFYAPVSIALVALGCWHHLIAHPVAYLLFFCRSPRCSGAATASPWRLSTSAWARSSHLWTAW